MTQDAPNSVFYARNLQRTALDGTQALYLIHPSQFPANPDQTADKASLGQSTGGRRKYPWAVIIVCYMHGMTKTGWPLRTHPIQFWVDNCVCYKEHRYGGHDEFCST